jgi:hypothetical protein
LVWRLFFSAFALFCLYGASPLGDPMAAQPTGPGLRWALVAIAAALLVVGHRPHIQLTRDAVILRNLVTTNVVPLKDIIRADVSNGGLRLERRSGPYACAAFIGEAGLLTQLLGRHTRGHVIASTINQALSLQNEE